MAGSRTGEPFNENLVTGGYAAHGRDRLPDKCFMLPKPFGSLWRFRTLRAGNVLPDTMFMGYPHEGQEYALSEIECSHSGQEIRAI